MGLNLLERQKLQALRNRSTRRSLEYRTFVHITDGHDKFWKIAQLGSTVYREYGANGTPGTTVVKTLPSYWAAVYFIRKLVNEKLAKGYQEL